MLCRLCLKDESDTLEIFSDMGYEINMAKIIGKHFSFEPKPEDCISNVICKQCWSKVHDFHKFYELVEGANQQYLILKQNVTVKKESDEEADEACLDNLPVDVQIVVEPIKIEDEEAAAISKIADEELIDEPLPFTNDSDSADGRGIDALESRDRESDETETLSKRKVNRKSRKRSAIGELETDNDENLPLSKLKQKRCKKKPSKKLLRTKSEDHEDEDTDSDENVDDSRAHGAEDESEAVQNKTKKTRSHRKSASFQEKARKVDEAIGTYTSLKCDICEVKQITFAKLVRHMKVEHNIAKGYAICCDRKYTNRRKLYDHVQIHINPDCYKCIHCGRLLGNAASLRQHILTKHQPEEAKPFQCKDCFNRYATEKLLKKHAVKHDERTHICDKCQKAFPSSGLLAQHSKISHDGYGIMCDICAKIFPGPAAFEKHQLQHKGIVPPKLQCDICLTWLKDKDCLRMHRSRHNQEGKLHLCGFCGKAAPNRIAMLKHQRDVHTSKRKFQCTFCDKSFKRAIHLREHMTSHTGEALYSCPHCPRTFNNSGNMHSHRKKMHPAEFEEARRNRIEMRKMPPPSSVNSAASLEMQHEIKH